MKQYSKNQTSPPSICFRQLNLRVFNHLISKIINIPCLGNNNRLDPLCIKMIVRCNSFKKMMGPKHRKTKPFRVLFKIGWLIILKQVELITRTKQLVLPPLSISTKLYSDKLIMINNPLWQTHLRRLLQLTKKGPIVDILRVFQVPISLMISHLKLFVIN